MSETPKGLLFVLVGPGGTGKNTLMNIIKARHPHIKQLATATTREIRPGEQQGREHHFVTLERFREMIANNELLEHQEVTPGRYYGIIRATIENSINNGENLMADIEVLGAKILRETFPDDTALIFVTVPGATATAQLDTLRERMEARMTGELTEKDHIHIQQRLERAQELEFPFMDECDMVIVNDEQDRAVNELEQFILDKIAERRMLTTEEACG